MKINALKFTLSLADHGPEPVVLNFKKPEDLNPYLRFDEPTIFLINTDDMTILSGAKEMVVNRGKKHPAKPLSFYLLKKDLIPLIDGNFTGHNQVKRSLRAFLKNAEKAGEKKLFLIAAKPDIFSSIRSSQVPSIKSGNRFIEPEMDHIRDVSVYLGDSEKIEKVRQNIQIAARVDYPVLILGPPGTGKELVANEIHRFSKRSGHNMITVNCSAIPEHLLESELFGYKKGAFSGATTDRTGKWKLADKGTLFLDEIGDLKPDHQVKILRAIETNTFYPVGSETAETADVRILSATNRDIHPLSSNGRFREDLYYRLCGIIIQTPALNDHTEDIPGLVEKIWPKIIEENRDSRKAKERILNPKLSREVIKKLQAMRWPGNVRQLKNTLRRLYAYVGELKPIGVEDLVSVVQYENVGVSKETENIARIHRTKQAMIVLETTQATLDFRISNYDSQCLLETFIDGGAKFHLDEIESLCKSPLNLSESVFIILNEMKGKLLYFSHLFTQNTEEAFDYWRNQVKPAIIQAVEKIRKEYNKLGDTA